MYLEIVEAENLLGRDVATGKSDPYVTVLVGQRQEPVFKTEVKKNDLNPRWNADCTFMLEDGEDDIKFACFDKDFMKKDEALGTARLSLSGFDHLQLRDIWLTMEPDGNCKKATGRIHVRIWILSEVPEEALKDQQEKAQKAQEEALRAQDMKAQTAREEALKAQEEVLRAQHERDLKAQQEKVQRDQEDTKKDLDALKAQLAEALKARVVPISQATTPSC